MDVTALDDDEIMQHCFMGALTLLMKHSCSCDKQKGEVKGFARGKLEGKLEGRMEGRLEGQLEGKQETARNMLNSGISRNMLQELTSIAEEELNMLKY